VELITPSVANACGRCVCIAGLTSRCHLIHTCIPYAGEAGCRGWPKTIFISFLFIMLVIPLIYRNVRTGKIQHALIYTVRESVTLHGKHQLIELSPEVHLLLETPCNVNPIHILSTIRSFEEL
jgi:hypothetical protein